MNLLTDKENIMLKKFRTYMLSIKFYRLTTNLKLPRHLKDQLSRASSSVSLNLAEGAGKRTFKDQRKYYHNALGSFRECQAILELADVKNSEILNISDYLGASLYRLCQWTP